MKALLNCLAVAIVMPLLLVSCKKDNDNPNPDFDIANPVGYVILSNIGPTTMVYEFANGNKVNYITTRIFDEFPYVVAGNKITLTGANEYFIVSDGNVQLYKNDVLQNGNIRLLKKPETSQLRGKTFMGVYKKSDGSVLHPQFFYSFQTNADKVDAGFVPGTALRTENYTPIGNVASRTEHFSPEYYEMLVLIDGKLYATYIDNTSSSYAVLEEQ